MNKRPVKRLIIPLFLMNRGCPNRCAFCRRNGNGIHSEGINAKIMEEVVSRYLTGAKGLKTSCIQIAFYGGNFTGLHPAEQDHLLGLAGAYLKNGVVHSLRISTRPDFIREEDLNRLRRFHVTTVEIGAQSMSDDVLRQSLRGHSSADVERAIRLLKQEGFETGVHLMVGLPGDNRETFFCSVERVIRLAPHMARIHPTLVFRDTELAASYQRGEYRPLDLDEAIDLCRHALDRFERAGIPVIRIGLHPDFDMEQSGAVMAGPFHPAFRSLVEETRFFSMAAQLLDAGGKIGDVATFFVSPADESYFRGHNNGNVLKLNALPSLPTISILADPDQEKGFLRLAVGTNRYETDTLSNHIRICRRG